jgi:hypothetical protein
MGGKLTVKSTLGEGSTFTLRVPVRVLDEHELEAAAEAATTAAETEVARVAAAEEEQRGRAVASAAVAAAAAAATARSGAPIQASQRALSPRRRLHILVAVRPFSARASLAHHSLACLTDASHRRMTSRSTFACCRVCCTCAAST